MSETFVPHLIVFALLTLLTGVVYPAARRRGIGRLAFPRPGQRQPDRARRQAPSARELLGQPFSSPKLFLGPAVGDRAAAVQRRRLERLATRAR